MPSNEGDPRFDPVRLYRPAAGSQTIDHGVVVGDVSVDYAGATRPQGAGYDIGAYEVPSSQTPQPPQVNITASATSGVAPLIINFAATVTVSSGGTASYLWDFGDGQTSAAGSRSPSYGAAGAYATRATVLDGRE